MVFIPVEKAKGGLKLASWSSAVKRPFGAGIGGHDRTGGEKETEGAGEEPSGKCTQAQAWPEMEYETGLKG